jgi:hypothetical protein
MQRNSMKTLTMTTAKSRRQTQWRQTAVEAEGDHTMTRRVARKQNRTRRVHFNANALAKRRVGKLGGGGGRTSGGGRIAAGIVWRRGRRCGRRQR